MKPNRYTPPEPASPLAWQAQEYARLFFGIAWRILRDHGLAEDACQRAFLKAHQALEQPAQAPDKLKAWLTRTVINESLQELRRVKLRRRAPFELATIALAQATENVDPMLRESIEAGLAELPDTTRAIVVLRIMQGLSGNEVKDLLGCSAAEVSRRLYLGMEQLRTTLRAKVDIA